MKKEEDPAKKIFKLMEKENCREIVFHRDPKTNLELVWVIDSIPELRDKKGKLKRDLVVSGGTRFAHRNPDAALRDALKLARAMTRKAAVLGVKQGGAKAVVISNQKKSKKLLHSVGDFSQMHKGLFQTAVDLGFSMEDGREIYSKSDYIDSLSHLEKGLGSSGENTAEGLMHGFDVICKEILKKPLGECSVAIQGLGAVGMPLARRLINSGVKVYGSDLSEDNCKIAKGIGVHVIPIKKILFQKVDILSPCAFGGIINKDTIPKLKCKIIAGGANNPLDDESKDEKRLLKRRIIYIPDFVINCAGYLQALVERDGGTVDEARKKSKIVRERLKEVIRYSKRHRLTMLQSALKLFS
jgi:leucine dehydrogenase